MTFDEFGVIWSGRQPVKNGSFIIIAALAVWPLHPQELDYSPKQLHFSYRITIPGRVESVPAHTHAGMSFSVFMSCGFVHLQRFSKKRDIQILWIIRSPDEKSFIGHSFLPLPLACQGNSEKRSDICQGILMGVGCAGKEQGIFNREGCHNPNCKVKTTSILLQRCPGSAWGCIFSSTNTAEWYWNTTGSIVSPQSFATGRRHVTLCPSQQYKCNTEYIHVIEYIVYRTL